MVLIMVGYRRALPMAHWATRNPLMSRALIAAAHLGTSMAATSLGCQLYENGFLIPDYVRYSAYGVVMAASLLYPSPESKALWTKPLFLQRKAHDLSLFAAGAVLMLSLGNQYGLSTGEQLPAYTSSVSLHVPDFSRTGLSINLIKKRPPLVMKAQDDKKPGHAKKIVVTILASILFTAIFLGVGILSCYLTCAGSTGAAIVVFFGGEFGFAYLYSLWLRKIWNIAKKSSKKAKLAEPIKT